MTICWIRWCADDNTTQCHNVRCHWCRRLSSCQSCPHQSLSLRAASAKKEILFASSVCCCLKMLHSFPTCHLTIYEIAQPPYHDIPHHAAPNQMMPSYTIATQNNIIPARAIETLPNYKLPEYEIGEARSYTISTNGKHPPYHHHHHHWHHHFGEHRHHKP